MVQVTCATYHTLPSMIELQVVTGSRTIHVYDDVLFRAKNDNLKILEKSVDLGDNWTPLYTFDMNVGAIVVAQNGNILVSQDSDGYWDDTIKTQWWLSDDGGATFSSVLTYATGGVAAWSFDVKGNEIVVSEYGTYGSIYVYYSNDGGATWSTIFTHPNPAAGSVHIHKVLFDPYLDDTIYVSNGDESAVRGVWYTQNNGSSWGQIPYHQPTWIEVDETYMYLFGDLTGKLHRILKTDVFAGTYNVSQSIVYDTTQDPEGEYASISFYSGRIVGDYIFAGGVAYGENYASNNKDAPLLVSWDQGEHWRVVREYPRQATVSSGASFISKPTSSGIVYIRNNNPNQTELLDTTQQDFIDLLVPLTRRGSTLTINGVKS